MITIPPERILYDFGKQGDTSPWTIVNDGVMGGRSNSALTAKAEGYAEFCGHISLENRGGFASVRLRFSTMEVSAYKTLHLLVKGTPGRYQVRCRARYSDSQSYVAFFETDGSWQEVSVSLSSMIPVFRGRQLDMPDYPAELLSEVGILVGNKKEEDFCLGIQKVWLAP